MLLLSFAMRKPCRRRAFILQAVLSVPASSGSPSSCPECTICGMMQGECEADVGPENPQAEQPSHTAASDRQLQSSSPLTSASQHERQEDKNGQQVPAAGAPIFICMTIHMHVGARQSSPCSTSILAIRSQKVWTDNVVPSDRA